MNPLQTRLAALRRRLCFVLSYRGVCSLLAVLVGGLALGCLIDRGIFNLLGRDLGQFERAVFLTTTLLSAAWVGYFFLIKPLSAPMDNLSLALRVEEEYPILQDALASTVQFLESPAKATDATSPALKEEAMKRAQRLAQGCDFFKAVKTPRGHYPALALATVLLGVGVLSILHPDQAGTGLARLLNPFGAHAWPAPEPATQLALSFPKHLGYGQKFVIRGQVTGVVPDKAIVEFEGLSPQRQAFRIAQNADGSGTLVAAIDMTQQQRGFKFRVRANDAVSPAKEGTWHEVELRDPPRLANLNDKPSPQIELTYPRYTDLPSPVQLSSGTGTIDTIAGTSVVLRGATNRSVVKVWIEYRPQANAALEGAAIAPLGGRHLLSALGFLAGGQEVWGKQIAELDADGKEFTLRFRPWLLGTYELTLQDADGITKTYAYDLRITPDPAPTVAFERPSRSQSVLPDAELTLQALAEDEVFAVKSIYVEVRRKANGSGKADAPRKIMLYDGDRVGAFAPLVMSMLSGNPVPAIPAPIALRPKRLSSATRISLAPLKLKEGDVLVLQACADDFNDVQAFPAPGRSTEIELIVVSKNNLLAQFEEGQAKVEAELMRLRDMQEKAIARVIKVEQKVKTTGKVNADELIELAEAEQMQKQIQARIGQKEDEGLRAELSRLQQLMRDNKLPASSAQSRLKVIKSELDRLAREHLPQIEPELAGARRNLENDAKPAPQKTEEQLAKARGHQDDVRQTIDELLKHLEAWAGTHQLKGELREIIKEQRDLQNDTKMLAELQRDPKKIKLTPDQQAELRRIAEMQVRLGGKTDDFLKKLNRVAQDKAIQDPAVAERIRKALDKDDAKYPVSDEMKSTAGEKLQPTDDKKKPLPPNLKGAIDQQGESIKTLEAMAQELDEKREDEVLRLTKKHKDEQKNLAELKNKLEKLQAKVGEAQKIENPAERAAALKKLGEEEQALQQELEKKARELARLQAPRAADALNEAADKLGKAAGKLQQGLDPDEGDQRQAQQKIDDAAKKLDQARQEVENELAREQLARLADRIKGLKERQDAAIEDGQRLHKGMLLEKMWTPGKIDSLRQLGQTQRMLAKETDGVREKLKGAFVFESVVEKSVKSMEEAAEAIQNRYEKNKGARGVGEMLKEQLDSENRADQKAQKAQADASKRLQRLLDAVKEEMDVAQNNGGGGGGEGGGGEGAQKGRGVPGDGIPPMAQLKALRGEQQDVNDRTREFAERFPDIGNLPPEARAELDQLRREQERLFDLFQKMAAAVNGEGGNQ